MNRVFSAKMAASVRSIHGLEGGVKVSWTPHTNLMHHDPQRLGRPLCVAQGERGRAIVRISQNADPRGSREQLLEQLQPLGGQLTDE
jgi:hypothetical protein